MTGLEVVWAEGRGRSTHGKGDAVFMEIGSKVKETEDQTRLNLGSWSDIVSAHL